MGVDCTIDGDEGNLVGNACLGCCGKGAFVACVKGTLGVCGNDCFGVCTKGTFGNCVSFIIMYTYKN